VNAANFTATVPRYGQMVKEPNKLKKVQFAREVITNNDKFNNVIKTISYLSAWKAIEVQPPELNKQEIQMIANNL
jgi:hypothetical protein